MARGYSLGPSSGGRLSVLQSLASRFLTSLTSLVVVIVGRAVRTNGLSEMSTGEISIDPQGGDVYVRARGGPSSGAGSSGAGSEGGVPGDQCGGDWLCNALKVITRATLKGAQQEASQPRAKRMDMQLQGSDSKAKRCVHTPPPV